MKKEMVMICVMVAVCLLILGTTAQAGLTVVTPRAVTTQLNEVEAKLKEMEQDGE